MKKIIKLILLFCIVSSFVTCMNRGKKDAEKDIKEKQESKVEKTEKEIENDKEVEKIEKEVEKENLADSSEMGVSLLSFRGKSLEGIRITFFIGENGMKKIVKREKAENGTDRTVTEYYLVDERQKPYFWKSVLVGSDGEKKSETKYYYKIQSDGTVGELFRIVKDGKINDGKFDSEFLEEYNYVSEIIDEDQDGRGEDEDEEVEQ